MLSMQTKEILKFAISGVLSFLILLVLGFYGIILLAIIVAAMLLFRTATLPLSRNILGGIILGSAIGLIVWLVNGGIHFTH